MKRIAICFDGTWSKLADKDLALDKRVETNVCRLYDSIRDCDPNGIQQVKWYDEGVGSKWYDRYIWMQDKAAALGLALDPVAVGAHNYLGECTDSYARFLGGVYARKNARHYRTISATRFGNETIDDSVLQRRREDCDYEPQNNGLPKFA